MTTWQLFQHKIGVDDYLKTTCDRPMTTSIPESQKDANRPIVPEAPPLLTLPCRRSFTKVSFLFLKSSLEFEVSDILADDVKRKFDVLLNVIPRK